MGYSFGGYHAPRICAFDKRYAACVAFGAMHWNVYDFVKGHAPTDPRATSASTFQFRWVVRRARQRNRAGMGEEVHARRRRAEDRMPVPGAARRERPHRAAAGGAHSSTSASARRRRTSGSSPPRKAAPSTARSITGSRRRLHRRLAAEEYVMHRAQPTGLMVRSVAGTAFATASAYRATRLDHGVTRWPPYPSRRGRNRSV